MGNNRLFIKQYEPDEITDGVQQTYCRLLKDDYFHNIPDITYGDARWMAFNDDQNSLASMRESARNPLRPNLLTAHFKEGGPVIASMRIGVEGHDDRPDMGFLQYNLARVARTLGLMNQTTWRIFSLGVLPAVSDNSEFSQQVFRELIFSAIENRDESLPPPARLSAFIDVENKKLAELMESMDPRRRKIGSRVVKLAHGGVVRPCRRYVTNLPQ